jgi:hypothetical protein
MRIAQKKISSLVTCVLSLALCVNSVTAQQQTGVLRGQLKDILGGVILGATVTVMNADGVEKRTPTEGEGRYEVSSLIAGIYTVRASREGFAPYENTTVVIVAGRTVTLDVAMMVGLKEENVEVSPDARNVSVDAENYASAIILRGKDLESLSDDPDQLADDLRALAGGIEGPNGTQFLVDGFAGARIPSKSSILEVRINANPFTAEQDNLGFGRVEITTKAGAGSFNGQGFVNFNDESLNARNPYAPNRAPYQALLFGVTVTGPIIAKKSSYFFDYEERDIDENAIVNATILDSSFNVVPFSTVVVTPQRRKNFTARFDHQLNKTNTLVARYNLLRTSTDNAGIGGFSLPSRAMDLSGSEHTLQLSNTMIVNESTLNVTRFQFIRRRNERAGDNSVPGIIVQQSFIGGGSQVGLAFNDADRYELQNYISHVRQSHYWNVGGRLRLTRITDVAPSDFGGTFVFSSLEQFRRVLLGVPSANPSQFTIASGDPLAGVNQWDFGGFIQDDWRVRPNFTLSVGLRFESQNNTDDKLDIAPRIAFAWAPGSSKPGSRPKTVIRGGGGIFYSRVNEDLTLQANRFNGINQQKFIVATPDFFPNIPPTEALQEFAAFQTTRRVAEDLKSPYSIKGVMSIERQLPLPNSTLSLVYIYEHDRHLLRSRNINAPLPGTFTPGQPESGVRPFGNSGNIFLYESSGKSLSQTLIFIFRGNLHKQLSMNARFGIGKIEGDTEGASYFPANSYDLHGEYGPQSYYSTYAGVVSMMYRAPWAITVTPIFRFRSAERFNITTGLDTNGDAIFTERPAFATDLSKPDVVVTRFGAFDLNAPPGQSLIPRNLGKAPGQFQANLRVSKLFGFGPVARAGSGPPDKRFFLLFTVQATNLFNSANQGPYIGNLSSPLFDSSNISGGPARRVELQLRFSF